MLAQAANLVVKPPIKGRNNAPKGIKQGDHKNIITALSEYLQAFGSI
jgi:hypothetical protein